MMEPMPIADGTPVLVLTHGLHYAGILDRCVPDWLQLSEVIAVFNTGPLNSIEGAAPSIEYGEPIKSLMMCIPMVSVQGIIPLHAVPTCRKTS